MTIKRLAQEHNTITTTHDPRSTTHDPRPELRLTLLHTESRALDSSSTAPLLWLLRNNYWRTELLSIRG